ncbi:MAG: Archaeal fructose-1 [Candidatus Alkanophagales archaeon MCA70_species_1]|nr:Archaeal fructose-1 [Candidatus Alkanophaga volatiphilum]
MAGLDLDELLEIADEVGSAVREYFAENEDYGEIISKREKDVTRKIDMFAERALERALEHHGLCARIISEELGDHVFPKGGTPSFTLIFDPIDGSTNATVGIPFFCSALAYSPKTDVVRFSDVQAGVVSTIFGRTYYAERGGGAYVDGKKMPRKTIGKEKPLFSIYVYGKNVPPKLLQLMRRGVVVRALGSIATELCLVAEGAIDAIIDIRGMLNGYDIAASVLILEEAGGIVTSPDGKRFEGEVKSAFDVPLVAALDLKTHEMILKMLR